jgi:Flp pilus assembly pilin Flp
MKLLSFISKFHREESGQDLVEYALVLAAVATAVVAGSATLSTDIANAMTTLNTKIQNALNGV